MSGKLEPVIPGQNLIWDLTGFWRDTEMRNDRERLLSHGISTHISKFDGSKNINTLSQRDYLHKLLTIC